MVEVVLPALVEFALECSLAYPNPDHEAVVVGAYPILAAAEGIFAVVAAAPCTVVVVVAAAVASVVPCTAVAVVAVVVVAAVRTMLYPHPSGPLEPHFL